MRRNPETFSPRTRPRVEQLEDRCQPAVFRLGAVISSVLEPAVVPGPADARWISEPDHPSDSHRIQVIPGSGDARLLPDHILRGSPVTPVTLDPILLIVVRSELRLLPLPGLPGLPTGDRPDPSPVVPSPIGEEPPVSPPGGEVAEPPAESPVPTPVQDSGSEPDVPTEPVAADPTPTPADPVGADPAPAPVSRIDSPAVAGEATPAAAPAGAAPVARGAVETAAPAAAAAPVLLPPAPFVPVVAAISEARPSPVVGQVPTGESGVFARIRDVSGLTSTHSAPAYAVLVAGSLEVAPAPRAAGAAVVAAAPVEVAPPPHVPAPVAADEAAVVPAEPVAAVTAPEEEGGSNWGWIAAAAAVVAAGGYWVARRYRLVRRVFGPRQPAVVVAD
jgi:hypothetical protein